MNNYGGTEYIYRMDVEIQHICRLMNQPAMNSKNIDVVNRFLKAYLTELFGSLSKCRFKQAMMNEENITIESNEYALMKQVRERLTGNSIVSFEITKGIDQVLQWLAQKEAPKYTIGSVFHRDLSIIFEDNSLAVEYKMKFET